MGEIQNRLSWSRSRASMFETCLRQYWLTYYGSWGGWKWNAPDHIRQTYILKQIQNRWMWAGTLVHDAIEKILLGFRAGHIIELPMVLEHTVAKMRQDYVSSRNKFYFKKPKTCALDEHHYSIESLEVDWVEVRDHVTKCVEHFWESPFREIAQHLSAEDWLSVEEMDSFELNGVTVWAIPDFAYRNQNGDVCIVDWKTGRTRGKPDPIQLACYALYGSQRWKCAPEDIVTVEYNLCYAESHTTKITSEILRSVYETIESSITEMQEKLISVPDNIAEHSSFPQTENHRICRGCRYREICFPTSWKDLFYE